MAVIYKITNHKNEVYIGQSRNIKSRLSQYRNKNCKAQPRIYESINIHGWENHNFQIIHELPSDIEQIVVDTYETYYWQQHIDCGFKMLNSVEPGTVYCPTDEIKNKISRSLKNRKLTLEHKNKISKSNIGENNANFNKEFTQDHKNKISISNKGKTKIFTEEHRKKLSEAKKGKSRSNFSLQTIEKMKSSQQKRRSQQK